MLGGFKMGKKHVFSVNEIIEKLDELHGRTLTIACMLQIEFEGDSIWHIPKSERKPGYESSLWANFDYKSLGIAEPQFQKFNGRHVIVSANVNAKMQGHFSLWPAEVTIRVIRKLLMSENS